MWQSVRGGMSVSTNALTNAGRDREEWRYRSFDGFLAPGESLKNVIARDWHVVHSVLNTTHHNIAALLRHAISSAQEVRYPCRDGMMRV